jgi:type VII secretion effector (TIGR04197 family)
MQRTIVVDSEYYDALDCYKETAAGIHASTELFKKSISKMIDNNSIAGQTAKNMISFLISMSTVLKATFKEQISLEATLCKEYLQKISEADTKLCFSPSDKNIQEMRYSEVAEASQKEGLIILNKGAVEQCISQLKEGPVKEIQDNLERVKRISFDKSEGAVKKQNVEVNTQTIASLNALLDIFNAFITAIESVAAAMTAVDTSIAKTVSAAKQSV